MNDFIALAVIFVVCCVLLYIKVAAFRYLVDEKLHSKFPNLFKAPTIDADKPADPGVSVWPVEKPVEAPVQPELPIFTPIEGAKPPVVEIPVAPTPEQPVVVAPDFGPPPPISPLNANLPSPMAVDFGTPGRARVKLQPGKEYRVPFKTDKVKEIVIHMTPMPGDRGNARVTLRLETPVGNLESGPWSDVRVAMKDAPIGAKSVFISCNQLAIYYIDIR
jgi:hypothetical protein